MASTYVFRDDLEADKQRAADSQAVTLGAPAPQPAMPTAPPPAPKPAPMPTAPAAPSQAENPFQAFSKALEAQNPFKQQVKQNVQQTLANPGEAADAANKAARDRLARESNAAQEEARSQAITNYGGYQSGQAGQALDKFRNARLMNEQSFELDAAANRAGAAEQARGNAINQGISLLGQEEQAQLSREQMGLQASEGAENRASSERVAFAGLDLERDKFQAADANAKQGLSLEANAQAMERLGMDREEAYRYAALSQAKGLAERGLTLEESAQELTRQGMKAEDARYYAGLASQEKTAAADRQSRETLAYAQIGSAERMQAADQVFESAQASLSRELEKLLSGDRIQAQFQLANLDRTFQERMQATGFVQEKELETMRADLQERLQAQGIQADAAKQIADQKFTELMAGREQAFETQMTNLKQAWASGERVATQDWDAAMRVGDQRHDELMAKLSSTLRLDEQQNAQAFQTAFQGMQNDFTLYRDTLGYDRETATRLAQEAFQERMQEAGFDQETAMQATQIAAQASENQKSRASQEMMAAASLAQQDSQFMQEMQQRYQFNDQDLALRSKQLEGQLAQWGLQGEQLKAAMADDKIKSAMNIVALGMEIGDGSPESMAPFVEQFGSALEGYMKGQGIDIASSDFIKALTPKPQNTGTTVPRTESGAIAPGTTVAGLDLSKVTRPELIAALGDPTKLDTLIKSGAVKQLDSIGSLARMSDAAKTFGDLGISDRVASTEGQKITFKPQTYVYYDGKPYELTSYNSSKTGSGFGGDEARNGYLRGIDLSTGKEVVLKHHRVDI